MRFIRFLLCTSFVLVAVASAPSKFSEESLGKAFDALGDDMDRHYSYFFLKKDLDWKKLKDEYRPKAIKAKDAKEFAGVLKDMLTELKDMHIWIETPHGTLGTYGIPFRRNWNPKAIIASLKEQTKCGHFTIVGTTKEDGFGCLIIYRQGAANKENVRQTVEAIRKLKDVPGFIVDLRGGASGGSEPLAKEVAQVFCGKDTVYAKSKYRNGPGHDDFTQTYERTLKASTKPYEKPVVCLIGHRCMSSGEAFVKMMKCLPHVTTVGERTRGSSGNPQPFTVPGLEIDVWYSRWVDMLPDGTAVEGTGIAPEIEVVLPIEAYKEKDSTWEKGIEVLRRKVVEKQRNQPAERGKGSQGWRLHKRQKWQ